MKDKKETAKKKIIEAVVILWMLFITLSFIIIYIIPKVKEVISR